MLKEHELWLYRFIWSSESKPLTIDWKNMEMRKWNIVVDMTDVEKHVVV